MNFLNKIFGTVKESQVENLVEEPVNEYNFQDYLDENFTWVDNKVPIKKITVEECYEEVVNKKIKNKVKMVLYKTRKEFSNNYTNDDFNVTVNKNTITVWDNNNQYLRLYKMPIPATREEADAIFSKNK
jgi:hypothetical protein